MQSFFEFLSESERSEEIIFSGLFFVLVVFIVSGFLRHFSQSYEALVRGVHHATSLSEDSTERGGS